MWITAKCGAKDTRIFPKEGKSKFRKIDGKIGREPKWAEFGKHEESNTGNKIDIGEYHAIRDSRGISFYSSSHSCNVGSQIISRRWAPPECSTCDENAWSIRGKTSWNASEATSSMEFSEAFQRTRSSLLALSLHPDSLNYSIHFCGASN